MLRLKQIDIHGFKSFFNRERLRFAGNGIAAVVGPNGCGKSNICDAVNWVLGEQSAKSLRGSRMRDVIFSGTRTRAPAGLATVTLTLHDPDRALRPRRDGGPQLAGRPAVGASGEIAVTRKLFSNGDSQYILNGKVVRLRDVQDLFLGTGLGPNHYAIIEQGRIGQLLSSRPLDRRSFVEEAACVTRYKNRRRLAELKLANASLNLERVHDILEEVRRQANSLKRQAERAQRYERYRAELREAQGVLFASRFRRAESERGRLETETAAARGALESESAETERMEAEFAAERERERECESRLDAGREKLSALRVETERLRERIDQQAGAVLQNSDRIERTRRDLDAAAAGASDLDRKVSRERSVIADLSAALDARRQRLDDKESECSRGESSMAEERAARDECRERMIEALAAISNARAQLGQVEETIAGHGRRLQEARRERAQAAERLKGAQARQARLVVDADGHRERLGETAAKCDSLRRSLAERTREIERLRSAEQDQRSAVSSLTARRDSLAEMLAHREYAAGAVKDIFDALDGLQDARFRPLGVLSDFLDVDNGYENAVEQLLGEDLECVVVDDWAQAGHGVRLVREDLESRAAFLVRSCPGLGVAGAVPAVQGAEPLSDHVRVSAPGASWDIGIVPKIRDAYLVDDAPAAERLAAAHPALYFVLPDGTWYRGNTVQAGRKTTKGPLVLKQQLRELAPRLQDAERQLEAAAGAIERAEHSDRADRVALEAATEELQGLEKNLLAVEHDLRQARRDAGDSARGLAVADGEIDAAETGAAAAEQRRKDFLAERSELEAAYEREEGLSARLAQDALADQQALARAQEERAALRSEVAGLEERRHASESALRRSESIRAEQRARSAHARSQIEQWGDENERLLASNADLERRVAAAAARQEELVSAIREDASRLRASRERTAALIEEVRNQRERVERSRQACTAKEVALVRVQSDLDHLASTCLADLGEPISEVVGSAPADLTPAELEDAENRHRQVKERIERLGPVNVLAREEYEQVTLRRDFLAAQEQDLLDSIRNTQQAIREIDTASREKFESAFAAINENFRRVFATLFGGGVGEMRLSEPDSKGEAGIDIVAQPPGKRLQNVALLSGGEKSLTVMALLMATFRYKPSPFCILDEVDSQLDEANTVRMRRLLQEMAPETQFVVITHSKTTMEVAETLYGVTMGEAGVSKLVSVRMAEPGARAERADRDETPVLAASA